MSADNGIYILKTTRSRKQEGIAIVQCASYPVYRIAHVQAIDNMSYYKEHQPYNLGAYMVDAWGKSKVYTDKGEAVLAAHELADTIEVLEYGVSIIDMQDMVFYGDM